MFVLRNIHVGVDSAKVSTEQVQITNSSTEHKHVNSTFYTFEIYFKKNENQNEI